MKHRHRAIVTAAALIGAAGLAQAQSPILNESFDNVSNLVSQGWAIRNNSPGTNTTTWFQGDLPTFGPQATTGYVAANFNATTGQNTISDWLITPALSLHNGDTLRFWTRTVREVFYPDRLQVRLNATSTTNVGTTPTDVGDFTTLLLDINPTYTLTDYPNNWTQFTVALSGLPAGGATGRIAFRYFVEMGGPAGVNSDYIGIDTVSIDAAAAADGACCLDTGCVVGSQGQCLARGGIFRGAGSACASAGCAAATVWDESQHTTGDAGALTTTAQEVTGPEGGTLMAIRGNLADLTDVDLYKIRICSPTTFSASTVNGTFADTKLALFRADGHGVAYDDDDPMGSGLQSALSHQFVTAAGDYYLAVTAFGNDPLGATSGGLIWNEQPYTTERAPDGPAATEVLGGWSTDGDDQGSYTIQLTGACFTGGGGPPPPTCYANCDMSTTVPFLNVNDFICFQGKFAAGDTYANCDHSTNPPVLNVNDFICFQGMFAAGCSAP